jgi:cell pole-organizing protein PopZ
MEEILASIRRIIADDDSKNPPKAADPLPPPPAPVATPPRPATPPPAPPPPAATMPPPPAPEPAMKQDDIDAMLSDLNAEEKADVLDLTEAMAAQTPHSDGFRVIDGQSDVLFEETQEEPPQRPKQDSRPLLSSMTSAAVDSAFNTLAHTVLVQNARTLEDLVREMLRPMLKTWLDDNLPGLVERLVRAEIERVSRGRG